MCFKIWCNTNHCVFSEKNMTNECFEENDSAICMIIVKPVKGNGKKSGPNEASNGENVGFKKRRSSRCQHHKISKPFCLWKTSLACLEHCNRGSSWGGREEKDIVKMKLWLKGAKQIVQVVDKGQPFLTGEAMKRLALLEDEDGLSIIVDGYTIYDVSSVLLCMHNLLSRNQEIKWNAN